MHYLYGPVPSRRLGLSLGISPIPQKTCNYSCIYCQLGRTSQMTNRRQHFFPLEDILAELDTLLDKDLAFDVITIVGEGEPSLYLGLGDLISGIKERVSVPVAVITNGALLCDEKVRADIALADLVLPSLDAYDETSFKRINRPHGALSFERVKEGLIRFSKDYRGQFWLEIMLMAGVNDDPASLAALKAILKEINYDRLYLNTPVRPPAESHVRPVGHEAMQAAVDTLGGISIDLLVSEGFHSDIQDDYEAVLSIIKRHPMHQYEIDSFLAARGNQKPVLLRDRLEKDPRVSVIDYRGYRTYRMRDQ